MPVYYYVDKVDENLMAVLLASSENEILLIHGVDFSVPDIDRIVLDKPVVSITKMEVVWDKENLMVRVFMGNECVVVRVDVIGRKDCNVLPISLEISDKDSKVFIRERVCVFKLVYSIDFGVKRITTNVMTKHFIGEQHA